MVTNSEGECSAHGSTDSHYHLASIDQVRHTHTLLRRSRPSEPVALCWRTHVARLKGPMLPTERRQEKRHEGCHYYLSSCRILIRRQSIAEHLPSVVHYQCQWQQQYTSTHTHTLLTHGQIPLYCCKMGKMITPPTGLVSTALELRTQ